MPEALKCLHSGCGKTFTDPEEACHYHPGPPVFHEGQKGWKCCNPRVLTFDEFLEITPCTTGVHSATEKPPVPEEKKPEISDDALNAKIASLNASNPGRAPVTTTTTTATQPAPAPPPESEDDDPSLEIPDGAECRRKKCEVKYKKGQSREGEECTFHPGVPIFHEGSKGYSCCKRRVLEFDQFLMIEGCKTKDRHMFVGSGKKDQVEAGGEEVLTDVRSNYYQTPTMVVADIFLKKIVKDTAKVDFKSNSIDMDLKTSDARPKRYTAEFPLYGKIDTEASTYRIAGSKLELKLVKADGASWPVLRSDEPTTGEILQIGKAGSA